MKSITSHLMLSTVAFAPAGARGSGKASERAPEAPPAGEITKDMANANAGALVPRTAPNIADNSVVLNGRAFKAKQITRDVFPQRSGQTLFVQITGKIYQGTELKNPGPGPKKEPPQLAECVSLETGELGLIIVNKVLAGRLDELFPDGGYVGKEFAITMRDVEGKRYKAFTVHELEAA